MSGVTLTASKLLLGDQQVTRRSRAGFERDAVVALGIGERLQGEAVADREEEADDRLGVVAEADHTLALLRLEERGVVLTGVEPYVELLLRSSSGPAAGTGPSSSSDE